MEFNITVYSQRYYVLERFVLLMILIIKLIYIYDKKGIFRNIYVAILFDIFSNI